MMELDLVEQIQIFMFIYYSDPVLFYISTDPKDNEPFPPLYFGVLGLGNSKSQLELSFCVYSRIGQKD